MDQPASALLERLRGGEITLRDFFNLAGELEDGQLRLLSELLRSGNEGSKGDKDGNEE